jgi:branched-chain amino acid aminotransferase
MPFNNGPLIWFDGKLVRWEDATIHVTTHALHYGSSVFEGIRTYETVNGSAIFRLEPHMRRLVRSAKLARIDLPWTQEQLMQAAIDVVENNGQPSCYIRPIIFRGSEQFGVDGRACPTQVAIMSIDWGRYLGTDGIEQGVDVGVSSWRRMAPGTSMAMAKIGGQYVNSQFMAMEAHDQGYNDAIALDMGGYISEGSGENIFVILDGVVHTPPVGSSILAGVTRDSALTILRALGYDVREGVIARDMLYVADEIFFTGTAAEITPVRSVDRIKIGNGGRGPVTKAVQDQFFGITSGKLPDRFNWLTPVTIREPQAGD